MKPTRRWGVLVALALAPVSAAGQSVVDLPAEDRPIRADFEEVYRVGSFDGEAWETFGEVAGAAFDAEGNLYLLDRQSSSVTVIDRDGGFVRTIGGPGEGPGEFRMVMGFAVSREGRVIVLDLGHRSYQLFDRTGAFERMVAMDFDSGVLRVGSFEPYPGGNAVVQAGGGSVQAVVTRDGAPVEPPTTRPIELISLEGDRIQTSTIAEGWMPPPEQGGAPTEIEGGGVRISMSAGMPRTWEPSLLVATLPDGGVAFSDSSAYTIKVAGASGDVTRVVRRPFEARPVTDRMQEAEKARRLEALESGDGPRMRMMVNDGGGARSISPEAIREIQEGQIAQMRFYPELPVINSLNASWSGKLWVQRRGEGLEESGPIDVLTSTGQYAGTLAAGEIEVPDAFGPDGLAAFVEEDDFGVPIVVVRRLPAVIN